MSIAPPVPPPADTRKLAGRAVRGGAVLMAARLLMQALAWPITLVVARLLSPDDYGLMTFGLVVLGLADLFADAGVNKALIQKEQLHADDLASAFTFSLGLSALLYALVAAAAWPLARFLRAPELALLLLVLGSLILLVPVRAVCSAILDRELRLGSQAGVHVVFMFLQSMTVLGLALAGAGYWALAAGVILGRALETAAFLWLAGWRPRLRLPRRGEGLVTFGLHVSGASVLWFLYSNADFAVAGKLLGTQKLGLYALAFQLITLPVQKLTANLNQVAYPVFCRLQDDRDRLRDWHRRLTVLLGCVGVPALAGMALVADDAFVLILGEKWGEAVRPFQLLAGAGVVMVYASTMPPLFNALGRPGITLRYNAVCVLLLPAAFLAGGLLWGVEGICLAWLLVYPLIVAGMILLSRPATGVGPWGLLWAQREIALAAALMICVVWLTQWGMADRPRAWRLAAAVAAGAAAYSGCLLAVSRHTIVADVRRLWGELRGR